MAVRQNSKERILDAAEAVVLDVGAGHMSLDLVAKKAGVSKGGLMYNFATKNALLKAMIGRFIKQHHASRDLMLKDIEEGPARVFKAGILTVIEPNEKRDSMGLSLLAASAIDPELLEPVRQAHRELLREIAQSGIKFERAALIALAVDGIMFGRLLKLSPFSKDQINKIKKEIVSFIDNEVNRS
ncbi:MAG: TetR/AcrR family transcriptional regulator [Candidatus Omnitrophota bacterium]